MISQVERGRKGGGGGREGGGRKGRGGRKRRGGGGATNGSPPPQRYNKLSPEVLRKEKENTKNTKTQKKTQKRYRQIETSTVRTDLYDKVLKNLFTSNLLNFFTKISCNTLGVGLN